MFQGGDPLEKSQGKETVSEFDRKVADSLNNPMVQLLLLQRFKEYMSQYHALNMPPVSLAHSFGAFEDHTLVVGVSGTGSPTVGNGVVVARFKRTGGLVNYYGSLTLGTTTDFGATGITTFSLPTNALVTTNLGFAYVRDDSTNAYVLCTAVDSGSSNSFILISSTGTGTGGAAISGPNGVPWAWAPGDQVFWNLMYEIP